MSTKINYRTAESVSPSHPDKLCDQISDAILDAYLAQDPSARTAIETVGGHGKVLVTGEASAQYHADIAPIIKRLAGQVDLIENIAHQSPEIARGVDTGGAGDQGIMVGYACDETPELLPLEAILARRLNQKLYGRWPYDGKTQITLKNGQVESIVASFQNAPHDELTAQVLAWLRHEPLAKYNEGHVRLHANPAGDWARGGFEADAGLTGRKLVIDNCGPAIPIGGGCFSGKDGTKVDRSGAYMARRIAVDYIRRHRAREVYCYLAYAIGETRPVEATVIVDGKQQAVRGYDLSPRGIINYLDLTKPQFEQTACWGHFGHGFAWDD